MHRHPRRTHVAVFLRPRGRWLAFRLTSLRAKHLPVLIPESFTKLLWKLRHREAKSLAKVTPLERGHARPPPRQVTPSLLLPSGPLGAWPGSAEPAVGPVLPVAAVGLHRFVQSALSGSISTQFYGSPGCPGLGVQSAATGHPSMQQTCAES